MATFDVNEGHFSNREQMLKDKFHNHAEIMRNFSSRFYWLQRKLMVSMAKTFSSVRIQTTQILSEIIFALLIKVS